ncbi:NAD(P)-dependent dehydrogenase, short-chain alcohol dehydrogenase family [Saccharopolyspora antimicrobica]|uniref:NAD(P)-dependent dehydrogenase (Short-subunit alcohol dehydrogenase family) n=4 Tax=Saccharopolyspora TaxID=1835 RepID=A0A1I4W5V4_9PSEU|nr:MULTISPECIES: SDR family NAD(P)-dependent oxidoreductase [Saccharopolyspora]RKT87056.1 NAD(P)-dependent dehydrogenase (short-subunit alcohol dehydrogenase family) [Saccharopolyspora antimicrobica]SEF91201.1 NAD(P)-dependent dehydrogenase, short-chain alcohol dehydrogenase family [Saccharopolyspora kobensis]SFC56487.1 NAD(P)-dependent dehydrogenase, short-chain alcohol dehydrogenase family [Saccharopolyspora kobensis]SFN08630.1 NAD(P)-dependent dehydrogenase, short-chain alcohol dehydrogenase
MRLEGISAAVTGGASGLGLATARKLAGAGATVTIIDLPASPGAEVAAELGARFAAADITDEQQFAAALDAADEAGPLRALVHCAGRGARIRLVEKDGEPGALEPFEDVIQLNLIGSYNALRLGAARMAKHDAVDDERGAIVLTASVAAFEGQIGQIAYTASKSAIVGMTLCAARDLASKAIRVCTIAPGIMDTPLLGRLREDVRKSLEDSVPNPKRLGDPAEFGALACNILENPYLNGETIRLDGAIRMAPR